MQITEASPPSRIDRNRRRILEGACKVFLERGFAGANMDQVAAAAGASKMTVYRHYRSKEELFSGVVSEMCESIVDAQVAKAMEDLPPREALVLFGNRMLKTVFSQKTLGLHRIVVAEGPRLPHLARLFYNSGPGASIAMLASYLRRHRDDPALRFSDPRHAAEEFMSLLRGYDHMRTLLGIDVAPSRRAMTARVRRAVEHLTR